MKNTSLSEKLILYFVLLGIGTILIVSTVSFSSTKKALMNRTFDQLTSLRIVKKNQIDQFYADRVRDISFLASTEDVVTAALKLNNRQPLPVKETEKRIALKFGSLGEHFSAFHLFGNNGEVVSGSLRHDTRHGSAGEPLPISDSVFTLLSSSLALQQYVICDMMVDRSSGKPFQLIGAAIPGSPGGKGPRAGFLVLSVPIGEINTIMLNNNPLNGLGLSGETYLVGPDFLMRSTSRFQSASILTTTVRTSPALKAMSGGEGVVTTNDYRNIPVLSSYGRITVAGLNWAILAEIDEQEAMVPVYETRTRVLLLSVVIIVIFFAFVLFISRRITKPLIRLRDATINLGEGHYNLDLPVTTHDELGALTGSFNIMARQIKEKTTELQQERYGRMRSVIDGEEMERQRLSRELHDGIGQLLIAIKLRLENLLYQDGKDIRNSIQELKKYFDQIIDEVRRISNNLMPSVLEAFGIAIACRNLFSETEEHTGLRIHFDAKGDYDDLDKKTKTYIYRLTQEALSNIVKHAGAREVRVNLSRLDDSLKLVIRDDGKGFSTDTAGNEGGNGIHNMRERVSLLDGKIDIFSEPGKGTIITLTVPIIVTYVKNQDFPR